MDQSLLLPGPIDCLARARRAAHAYQSEHQRVDAVLRPTGLTVARMSILEVLSRQAGGGSSVTDVALELGVHRTSAAAVVRHLCSIDLVVVGRDALDARRSTIRITSRGSAVFASACMLLRDV